MEINKRKSIEGIDLFPMTFFRYKPCKVALFLGKYSFSAGEKTDLGKYLNAFKYHQDKEKGMLLAKLMAKLVQENLKALKSVNYIIPVPPSEMRRTFQPAYFLADEISKILHIPVSRNVKKIKGTPLMKNVGSKEEKEDYLRDAFQVINSRAYNSKRVLIVDDVLTDGVTLSYLSRCLVEQGGVDGVFAVIATKTF